MEMVAIQPENGYGIGIWNSLGSRLRMVEPGYGNDIGIEVGNHHSNVIGTYKDWSQLVRRDPNV
jgi:hypothetical protein